MSDFSYSKSAQQYRDNRTGKFISTETAKGLIEKQIGAIATDIATIGDLLTRDLISVATWERQTAEALKTLHIQSYVLGRGGMRQMGDGDYRNISDKLRYQFQKLRGFSEDIINEGMSEAQFKARLDLYTNAARSSYENGRRAAHGEGWLERRVLGGTNNCDPCVSHAGRGWQPRGTLPGIGEQCDCMARCQCGFEFMAVG